MEEPRSELEHGASRPHLRSPDSWELCDVPDCEHERPPRSLGRFRRRILVAAGALVVYAFVCMLATRNVLSAIVLTAMAASVFWVTLSLFVFLKK
jgi:Flp pilus assembly protein TadB